MESPSSRRVSLPNEVIEGEGCAIDIPVLLKEIQKSPEEILNSKGAQSLKQTLLDLKKWLQEVSKSSSKFHFEDQCSPIALLEEVTKNVKYLQDKISGRLIASHNFAQLSCMKTEIQAIQSALVARIEPLVPPPIVYTSPHHTNILSSIALRISKLEEVIGVTNKNVVVHEKETILSEIKHLKMQTEPQTEFQKELNFTQIDDIEYVLSQTVKRLRSLRDMHEECYFMSNKLLEISQKQEEIESLLVNTQELLNTAISSQKTSLESVCKLLQLIESKEELLKKEEPLNKEELLKKEEPPNKEEPLKTLA